MFRKNVSTLYPHIEASAAGSVIPLSADIFAVLILLVIVLARLGIDGEISVLELRLDILCLEKMLALYIDEC